LCKPTAAARARDFLVQAEGSKPFVTGACFAPATSGEKKGG